MIIGVTGPMQSGKQELGQVWRDLGYRFMDLNAFVDEVHRRDRGGFYASIDLGSFLDAQGHETLGYYQMLRDVDGLHRAAQDHELEYVHERLFAELANIGDDERVVLSWGYTYQLMGRGLRLDFMFVFQSEEQVWCDRIRRAFLRLGWQGGLPTNREIAEFAGAIELDPDLVLAVVRERMPKHYSLVDTSSDDWGEENLRAKLAELGW